MRVADGTYRMAVNEYQFGCGLGTWRSNSQIAWASSPDPIGPFKKLGVAVPAWATNPAVFFTPDGYFVTVTCGAGDPCSPGASSTPATDVPPRSRLRGVLIFEESGALASTPFAFRFQAGS